MRARGSPSRSFARGRDREGAACRRTQRARALHAAGVARIRAAAQRPGQHLGHRRGDAAVAAHRALHLVAGVECEKVGIAELTAGQRRHQLAVRCGVDDQADGGVARIAMNDPATRNAGSVQMGEELPKGVTSHLGVVHIDYAKNYLMRPQSALFQHVPLKRMPRATSGMRVDVPALLLQVMAPSL